jgi:transposase
MFVYKKKNRSGSTSVVIVLKTGRKFRYLKTVGISSDAHEIERLCLEGQQYVQTLGGQRDMFADYHKHIQEEQRVHHLISNIENVLLNGTQLILSRIYSRIGFDTIDDQILKHLAIARLSQPMSKAATVDYLRSHFEEDVSLTRIYRYLDKLYNTQQDAIQRVSLEHTQRILGGKIGLLFYDVTTLYFETEQGDDLRETGFSKDGKHSQPQIVLGLLVSKDGYPLSYSIYNGSQYEGHTMIPIVEDFVQRFNLEDFVVVADSGLMSKSNLSLLESGGYKYIIGARIKNETHEVKEWIWSLSKLDGEFNERRKGNARLIIGYSQSRAKKDRHNREKGVKRLQQAYKSGSITKENINKKGYNKFLDISDNVKVQINQEKIRQDEKWDGLKGYITNTALPAMEVYEQYNGLWVIERAYRITKGTIELRPMFHFNPRRIEAHVCICFVAYKMYKEFERVLTLSGIGLSVDKVLGIAKTITTVRIRLPIQNRTISETLLLTKEHKLIGHLFSGEFWQNIQDV